MNAAPQPIAFPDVEALLVGYLTQELPARGQPVSVHTRIPTTRPAAFVSVSRIGGTRPGLVVDAATLAVECWAATPAAAYGLCAVVRALVHALPGRQVDGVPVYAVGEYGGPVALPDAVSAQARYTFTISLSVRGRPL